MNSLTIIACTDPIIYSETEYGEEEYVVTTAKTLYSPLYTSAINK